MLCCIDAPLSAGLRLIKIRAMLRQGAGRSRHRTRTIQLAVYYPPPLTDIPQYSFYENSAIPQYRNWISTIYTFSHFRFVFFHNIHNVISTIYKTVFPQFTRSFSTIYKSIFPQYTKFPQFSTTIYEISTI